MATHTLTVQLTNADGTFPVTTWRCSLLTYPQAGAGEVISGSWITLSLGELDDGLGTVDLEAGAYVAEWHSSGRFNRSYFTMPDTDAAFEDCIESAVTYPTEIWRNFDRTLTSWAQGVCYQVTAATRNAAGVITSGTLLWPDGSAGALTATVSSEGNAWDSYSLTHANSGKTVTQATVTRDSAGNVTVEPALSISPAGDVTSSQATAVVGGFTTFATTTLMRASEGGETLVYLLADDSGRAGFYYRGGTASGDEGNDHIQRTDGIIFTRTT